MTMIRHGACGAEWTGTTNGHCSGCHLTFSRGSFDKHQRMRDGKNVCLAPEEVGLVGHTMPWGTLWRMPADPDRDWSGQKV